MLVEQLKILFPEGGDEGLFVLSLSLHLMPVHRLSALTIEGTALKKVSKLAPYGSGLLFTIVAPDLCVAGISGEVLRLHLISQHGHCVTAALSFLRFSAAPRLEGDNT